MNDLTRREFLKTAGISSTAFIMSFHLPVKSRMAWAGGKGFSTHYVIVSPDDQKITFIMDKSEMGQGVITGQLTMFCEEAGINPLSVEVLSAPVDDVYGTLAGMQLTGGSTSTKERWEVLRQAGANMRGAFIKVAAKKLSEPESNLFTEEGLVKSKSTGKSLNFFELSSDAAQVEIEDFPLKSTKEFKYIGKPTKKVDAQDKSMGTAEYGVDFEMEGLLTAIVLRCPVFGGKLKSFESKKVAEIPGIKKILKTSRGVAIVGEKYWQVDKARSLVTVDWDLGENSSLSSESIRESYKNSFSKSGKEFYSKGDPESVFENSENAEVFEAEYSLPYLSHSPMEPMNASAHVTKDRVDIWSPNQGPTLIRNSVADFLGRSRENVFVHTTKYLGGGFGRRSTLDYSLEAAEISQLMDAPVKVMWSREDDTRHSPMRPLSQHRFRALLKNGNVEAWHHQLGAESIMQGVMPGWVPLMMPDWLPSFVRSGIGSVAGTALRGMNVHMTTAEGTKVEYDIPNVKVEIYNKGFNIPIHFWRSVGHSYNGFVVESFIDELAVKLGKDPLQHRKDLLKGNSRALAVIDAVKELSKWGRPLPEGVALGFAYHFSFDSYVAEVAEVEIKDDKVKVRKVYCAVDCGIAVNPDIVEDQMKSGIVYGLSAALSGEITLSEGRVVQSNFHDYPVVRMSESPEIEVTIIESSEKPTGVGEPGLPPIAAAVGNALFSLTGKRHRSLPFSL